MNTIEYHCIECLTQRMRILARLARFVPACYSDVSVNCPVSIFRNGNYHQPSEPLRGVRPMKTSTSTHHHRNRRHGLRHLSPGRRDNLMPDDCRGVGLGLAVLGVVLTLVWVYESRLIGPARKASPRACRWGRGSITLSRHLLPSIRPTTPARISAADPREGVTAPPKKMPTVNAPPRRFPSRPRSSGPSGWSAARGRGARRSRSCEGPRRRSRSRERPRSVQPSV